MDGYFTENEWPKLYANAVAMVQQTLHPAPVSDSTQSDIIYGNVLTNIILKE
jgi:hypothetical protein